MVSLSHLEIVWLVDGVADPAVAGLAPTVAKKKSMYLHGVVFISIFFAGT